MSNDERKTTLASTYPLPKPPANFTGRATALEWLRHNLHPGRVLTIHGPGGLGKTAVTNHCLHQLFAEGELQRRFPQGLIFHTFYHQPRTEQAYLTILEGVGLEPPNQLEAMERLVRHVLQSQRLVLVLDGAEEAVDLEGILKLQGQAGVLISSRKREDVYGEGHELERFPNEEAVLLLQKIAGRFAQPTPAAQELCALVANLPLAVQLVGRFLYMRQEPAAEYVTWLKNAPMRQVHLKTGRENSLPLFYQRTFDQLVPEMQAVLNLFRYLAFASVPLPALQAALGVEERPLKNWVNELINYSLLERTENGRVQPIHALIYQWVRESGPVEPEQLTRLMEYWAKQGQEAKAAELFAPLSGLAIHWEQLIQLALTQQLYREADNLIEGVDWYLYLQSHSQDHLRFRQLSVQVGQYLSQHDQVYAIYRLGKIHHKCAEYGLARERYEEARPIYAQIGARLGEANCIQALGDVHLRVAEYGLARERYEEARPIYAQIGDRLGEANCIKALGDVHRMVAEYGLARERYEEARPLFAQIGDRLGEANCIRSLGDVHLKLKEYTSAYPLAQQSLSIYQHIGAKYGEAASYQLFGQLYQAEKRWGEAQQAYQNCLQICHQIGAKDGLAETAEYLGLMAQEQGDIAQAKEWLTSAVQQFSTFAPHEAERVAKLLNLLTNE
jgi:tetratricopeptide (TPR) repeat protein